MKKILLPFPIIILVILTSTLMAKAQQTVVFQASDGLEVTADLYVKGTDLPYIILLHQARYSRGEYREIAPKLVNLGYNCLAVDLRSGGEVNGVVNRTAMLAAGKRIPADYYNAMSDVEGAIGYVKSKSDKPIVLWGSSYSASLALIAGAKNLRVTAIVAFSPGEYFDQPDFVSSKIGKLAIPVLTLSSKAECQPVRELLSGVNPKLVSYYCPTDSGQHGSKALWQSNPSNGDYWMAITMFFSRLNKN